MTDKQMFRVRMPAMAIHRLRALCDALDKNQGDLLGDLLEAKVNALPQKEQERVNKIVEIHQTQAELEVQREAILAA